MKERPPFSNVEGPRSSSEPNSYDFVCFTSEEAPGDDTRVKPQQQDHDKPKGQGEELVEMNLAT